MLVEISQIGKVCHTRCPIYYLAGDCIFPHEGVFGVVLKGGEVNAGDEIQVVKLGDGPSYVARAESLFMDIATVMAGRLGCWPGFARC